MNTLIFAAVLVVALAILSRTLYRRFTVLLKVAPVARFDRIPDRVNAVVQYAFGQKKFVVGEQPLPGDEPAGWTLYLRVWAFPFLASQVIHRFVRAVVPDFGLQGPS